MGGPNGQMGGPMGGPMGPMGPPGNMMQGYQGWGTPPQTTGYPGLYISFLYLQFRSSCLVDVVVLCNHSSSGSSSMNRVNSSHNKLVVGWRSLIRL
jgi:hypothetical protein